MDKLKEMKVAAYCLGKIETSGYSVSECVDYSTIPTILESLGKPYVTPHLSPNRNDFTQTNSFWMLVEKDGVVVAAGGVRLEDLGQESVGHYWDRLYKRQSGHGVKRVANPLLNELSGKLAYLGDLHLKEGHRGSRTLLHYSAILCHVIVSIKWSPDWTYAFLHKRDVVRGAAALYGFTRAIPQSKIWHKVEEPRRNDEYCASLSKDDYIHLIDTFSFE